MEEATEAEDISPIVDDNNDLIEDNSSRVEGVEENVASRFVDYTMATPWERFVADIERTIKSWIKPKDAKAKLLPFLEMDYDDKKFLLLHIKPKEFDSLHGFVNQQDISLWFGVEEFIVLSPISDNIRDCSLRRILFSGVCTGLELSKCSIPVFLISSKMNSIDESIEVLGYKVLSPHSDQYFYSDRPQQSGVIHYESMTHDSVGRKHSFYYLDGLLRLFGAKLWSFSYGNISISDELVVITVWELYNYSPSKALQSSNSSSADNPDVSKSKLSNVFGAALRTHPAMQSTLDDLSAGFAALYSETILTLPVTHISIQLCFKDMKQGSVVDNDYYTTLLPSKLPPKAFVAKCTFAPPSSIRANQTVDPTGMCVYSSTLRRLLSFYILCKTGKRGLTLRSFINPEGTSIVDNLDIEKAQNIAYVLSKECRTSLTSLSSTALPEYLASIHANNAISSQHDLLMRVFSRSLWIDKPDIWGPAAITEANDGGEKKHASVLDYGKIAWNWLGNTNAAPVGSLLSLASTFMGGLQDISSMATFWQELVIELRVHWENHVPIPRLHPTVPIDGGHSSSQSPYAPTNSATMSQEGNTNNTNGRSKDNVVNIPKFVIPFNYPKSSLNINSETSVASNTPLWKCAFWDDALKLSESSGTPFSLPNPKQNLLFQKLQMVNFCTLSLQSGSVVSEDIVETAAKASRRCTTYDDSEGLFKGSNHVTTELIHSTEVLPPKPLEKIVAPKLLRRLPKTSDLDAQQKHMLEKLNSGGSRTANDNPMLRWQIMNPALVSDIRAFKDSNADASIYDFIDWYGGGIISASIEEIWSLCTPTAAESQRQLFKAEQEAEKALGYIEGLSAVQVVSTLISSAMISLHMMLWHDLYSRWADEEIEEMCGTIAEDLERLGDKISHAISLLNSDTPMIMSSNQTESAISQETLQAIDEICKLFRDLEILRMQMDGSRKLLDDNPRLTYELAKKSVVTAHTPVESKILFSLAKCASFGEDSHSWHSYDGRELGPSSRKICDVRCTVKSSIINGTAGLKTNEEDDKSYGDLRDQRMRAIIQNGSLRVNFCLSECDN